MTPSIPDILPWRDPKITKKLRMVLLEMELALRVQEVSILRGSTTTLTATAAVNRTLREQEADIHTLVRRTIKEATRLIGVDRSKDAIELLNGLVTTLKPPRPPKKIV